MTDFVTLTLINAEHPVLENGDIDLGQYVIKQTTPLKVRPSAIGGYYKEFLMPWTRIYIGQDDQWIEQTIEELEALLDNAKMYAQAEISVPQMDVNGYVYVSPNSEEFINKLADREKKEQQNDK